MTRETSNTGKIADERSAEALERAFAAARACPPEPSGALLAAILSDAAAAQPDGAGTFMHPARPRGFWGALWRGLGGWPAGAALAASVVLGVALGYGAPDPVARIGAAVLGSSLSEGLASGGDTADDSAGALFSGYDTWLTEG